jgi:hypothetical protein
VRTLRPLSLRPQRRADPHCALQDVTTEAHDVGAARGRDVLLGCSRTVLEQTPTTSLVMNARDFSDPLPVRSAVSLLISFAIAAFSCPARTSPDRPAVASTISLLSGSLQCGPNQRWVTETKERPTKA